MRVYAKISRAALRHNMEAMRDSLPEGIRIAGVVKADAYGHGAALVADTIEPYVSFFCVATAEEAFGLRKHGIEKPVLVLGPVFDADYEDLVRAEIRPSIFTEAQAEALSKAAEKLGRKAAFHLAVDTGMHRIGLNPDAEGVRLAEHIAAFSNLDFEGMFTHFYRATSGLRRLRNCKNSAFAISAKHCGRGDFHPASATLQIPRVFESARHRV